MRLPILALLLAALALLSPARAQDAAKRDKVTVVLNWFPEAEHGGYYAALVHKYYEEAGLDVEILPGGVDVQVLPMVAMNRVTFGVENADQLLLARASQAPVVAVAAPIQVSPRCILVHEGSGIAKFEDLRDMTLAMSPRAAFSDWLRRKYPLKGVKFVPYPGNVSQFVVDPNYGCQGYNISEPFVARSKGAKPRVMMVADTGYNPYTSMIVASEKTLSEKPEVVARFVAASMKGWEKYLAEPAETHAFINRLNPEMGMDILDFGAKELQSMCLNDDSKSLGMGAMTAERWTTLVSQLEEIEAIKPGAVKAEQAWTADYLPKRK